MMRREMPDANSARSSFLPRTLGFIGIAGLAVLTLPDRSATRMYASPFTWVLAATLLLPVLALVFRLLSRADPLRLPARPWLWTCLGIALLPLVSALLSPYRTTSLQLAAFPLSASCLFLVLHDWLTADPARRERFVSFLTACAVVLVIVSLAHWLRGVATFSQEKIFSRELFEGRNPHPLGHANYTAGLMILTIPLLAHRAWQRRGVFSILAAITLVLALGNLMLSGSRGGLLGLAGLGLAVPFVFPLGWKRLALACGGVVLLAVALVVVNPRTRALLRGPDPAAAPNLSTVQRQAMLHAGVAMAAARPLVGWGPGTVPRAYPLFRARLAGGADNVLQLHGIAQQLLAELGAGGIFLAALAAFISVAGHHRSPIAFLALAGYAIFSLTDFQLDIPVFAAAVAALAALLAGTGKPVTPPARLGLALAALGASAMIIGLGDRDPAPALNAEALQLATRDSTGLTQARERLEASLRLDPDQEIAHFNLGWLLLLADQPAEAELHFRQAAQLVPDRGGVYLGIGLARLNRGDQSGASRALALECVNDPHFLASPWWNESALAALRASAAREFLGSLQEVTVRPELTPWMVRQAENLQTLAPRLGEVSPGPELAYRRSRTGYPVLVRNSDIAAPVDVYDVREDPRFPDSVPFPLPPKGWLPTPLLPLLLERSAPLAPKP